MSHAFRKPVELVIVERLPPFRLLCPACGDDAERCNRCGAVKIPGHVPAALCWRSACAGEIKRTSLQTIACTAESRYRLGWFKRCRELRAHVHQRCTLCNWRGLVALNMEGIE